MARRCVESSIDCKACWQRKESICAVYRELVAVWSRAGNGPIQIISLSRSVRFNDPDLRAGAGARELRARVIGCSGGLFAIGRHQSGSGTARPSCFKKAKRDALIRDARSY